MNKFSLYLVIGIIFSLIKELLEVSSPFLVAKIFKFIGFWSLAPLSINLPINSVLCLADDKPKILLYK